MRINGNYEDVTANALYGRRQAFTKLPEDQETGAVPAPDKGTSGVVHETGRRQAFTKLPEDKEAGVAPEKETPGVVYEKGSETSSKLYTSDGGMTVVKNNRTSSGSRAHYSGQEILDEINRYHREGKIYAIHNNGKETWLQGMTVEYRDGRPVSSKPIEGDKKYFNPDSVNAALGLDSPKTMSVKNNQVFFERNSYYQFTGKDGKSHTVLSMGNSLSSEIFGSVGRSTFDKEAVEYADFWDRLSRNSTWGLEQKYSQKEIRSKLEEAGIQNGFFTVTVGNNSQSYYLSQNKDVITLFSKEDYDKRYNALVSGKTFQLDKFQPGQTVTVGGKEYVLNEHKGIDIEYGAEVYLSVVK